MQAIIELLWKCHINKESQDSIDVVYASHRIDYAPGYKRHKSKNIETSISWLLSKIED